MNYYKRHLGDYAKDTKHLTTYQHGVYAVLLDWYYSSEKPVPLALAYKIVQARSGPERRATDEVLTTLFDLSKSPGFAHNKRADFDISKYQVKSDANSLIALERESTKRARNVDETCSDRAPSHKPVTTSHKKAKEQSTPVGVDPLFDGVDEQVVADFKAIRKAKKAAITKTAVDGIRKEAVKAGLTLQQALEKCCERGWAGFNAEWVGLASTASVPGGGRRELK